MRSLAMLTLFPVFLSFVNCQCEPPSYTTPEKNKLQVVRSDCTAARDCTADETPWDYFRVDWAGIPAIKDDWELSEWLARLKLTATSRPWGFRLFY